MDDSEHLSESVQNLLRERLETHDELEAALLLRAEPDREWSRVELREALDLTPELATDVEAKLVQAGIAARAHEGLRVGYRPASEALARAMDELAEVWQADPIEILRVMSANAVERVRGHAAETFARARTRKG